MYLTGSSPVYEDLERSAAAPELSLVILYICFGDNIVTRDYSTLGLHLVSIPQIANGNGYVDTGYFHLQGGNGHHNNAAEAIITVVDLHLVPGPG